jgi:hypothetical protein
MKVNDFTAKLLRHYFGGTNIIYFKELEDGRIEIHREASDQQGGVNGIIKEIIEVK